MLTEEQKAGLSEGEIAALEGDDLDAEETEEIEDDEEADDEEEAADDERKEEAPAEDVAGKPPVDEAQEQEEGFASPDMADAPFVSPGTIKYTDAVRADIKEQLDKIRNEYESGDKELAEYEAEKRKLDAENMNWQAATQLWDAEQAAFMNKFKAFSSPGPLRSALEGEISRIDRATGNKLSGMELLMAAKESVEKAMNMAPVRGVEQKRDSGKRPKAKRPDPSVHGVEHAAPAGNQGTGGEFSHMENMNGLELEAAVARMSDEQRDRWYRQG